MRLCTRVDLRMALRKIPRGIELTRVGVTTRDSSSARVALPISTRCIRARARLKVLDSRYFHETKRSTEN